MNAAPGSPLVSVLRLRCDGTVETTGRTTPVPGLILAEARGEWQVFHQRSGLSLGAITSNPELAMAFAAALAPLADWTVHGDELTDQHGAVAELAERFGIGTFSNAAPIGDRNDVIPGGKY